MLNQRVVHVHDRRPLQGEFPAHQVAAVLSTQAVGIIRAQRGTHFDPDVVDAFVAAEHDIEALSKTLTK